MVDLTGRTLLSKYRIERLLGQGGMGSVWQGVHTLTGRKIAIKVLDERFLTNLNVVQRFGREARAASAIKHDGIVEVLDLDQTEEGMPFLVMEFLEGELLSRRIDRRGKLGQDEVVRIGTLLLDALQAAHLAGVVHRDLKPDNIFLVPAGRRGEVVKILDFGISSKDDEAQAKLTVTGSVLGTPHYMSPEQAMGEAQLDQRVDIYGAAVVLYECCVGDVPYDAANYNKLLRVILDDPPVPPRKRGADISAAIEGVILRGMAKKREERYTTAAEFRKAWTDAAEGKVAMVAQIASVASAVNDDSVVARWVAAPLETTAEPASGERKRLSERPADPKPASSRSGVLPAARAELGGGSGGGGGGLSALEDMEGPPGSGALELDEAALSSARTSSSGRIQSPYQRPHTPESLPPPSRTTPQSTTPASQMGLGAGGTGQHAALGSTTGRHHAVGSGRASLPPAARTSLPPPPAPTSAPAESPPAPERPAWVPWAIRGGAAVAAFLVVVFGLRWAVRGGGEEHPDTSTPEPPPTTTVETVRAPSADWVYIDIDGIPPDARVRLDGLPGATVPLRVRRGSHHNVDISAPGYVDRHLEIDGDRNQHIRADMRPELGTGQAQ